MSDRSLVDDPLESAGSAVERSFNLVERSSVPKSEAAGRAYEVVHDVGEPVRHRLSSKFLDDISRSISHGLYEVDLEAATDARQVGDVRRPSCGLPHPC